MQISVCPECGANWSDGQTCTDYFHVMCAWELDNQLYDLHHLMVLCYHIQHPALYSPDALAHATKLLAEFLETDITPQAVRQRMAQAVDSSQRKTKIAGTPQVHGAHDNPVVWEMHASDVLAAGINKYYSSVHDWAKSILKNLRESGNLG